MQVNQKTAKELYSSLKNVSNLSTFQTVEQIESFKEELTEKPYNIRYKQLFYFCVGLSFVAQIASLVSSYAYFWAVFSVAIKHPYLLVLGVGVVLMTIEILKRLLLTNSLQSWFGLQRIFSPIPTLFAVILSILSMYASVIGGGSFGVDSQKEVVTNIVQQKNTDSLAKMYDTEIGLIRSEIASIEHRNSYKGATYLPKNEKDLVHQKEQRIKELQAAKDLEIANQKQQAAKDLALVRSTNQSNKQTYQYWFLAFECLFLACMFFMYDYKRKSVLESIMQENFEHDNRITTIVNEPQANPQTLQVAQSEPKANPTPQTPMPNQTEPQRIGFIFGNGLKVAPTNEPTPLQEPHTINVNENSITTIVNENSNGLRTCKHCGKEYTYKHHKQQYCSEKCRIDSWEKRTGKTLNKGKKND